MTRVRDEGGFSMIELVVVVALLGTLAAMASQALLSTVQTSNSINDRTAAVADVRGALEIVARDVRGADPVSASPTGSSLTVSLYCANAGVADCSTSHLRTVAYDVVGGLLQRTQNGTTSTILDRTLTSSTVFTYLDSSGAMLSSPVNAGCVQQVKITLSSTVDVSTTVALRNYVAVAGC